MSRRETRENAFKLVFEQLLRDDDINELYDIADEVEEITVNDDVRKIVGGTMEHTQEIEGIISGYSKSRSISRISKVNLAILKIAVFEALYDEKVPVNIAISEAVNLAEMYTYPEDISFINGVLGAFARDRKSEDEKNG
ncbi:MAG: transcription antitermination factor NusB [Ruminococcus sp.]|nr:transcription antitermination factor NusB [Ruminococcus sp.]